MFNDSTDLLTTSLLSTAARSGKDAEQRRIDSLTGRGPPQTKVRHRDRSRMTETESRLVSHFSGECERARSYLYSFHRQWYINIASILGTQGIRAESVAKVLKVNLKTAAHRLTHNSNKIGGYCRRLVGYLARSNPDIEFVAADLDDPIQVDYARGAKHWLDWQWTYDHWKKKHLETLNWAVSTGLGITKAVFNPTCGPRSSAVDENGAIVMGSNGRPLVDARGRPRTYSTGMAHTVVVPPFHYVYGISARNDEELNWNGEDAWMSFRQLEGVRPGAVDEFGLSPEPQFTNNSALYERQILQSVGPMQSFAVGGMESSEPGCRMTHLFVAPYYLDRNAFGEELYEQGAFMMFAQGKLITLEPNKYLELEGVNPLTDWNPYTLWKCYDIPGRMIPQGLPENVIPVREAINFILARQREAQRMMGQPRWFVQAGSIRGEINNDVAQTVQYGVGFQPPVAYTPPPMPAYIMQLVEVLEEHSEQIASQPPMMQGRAQGQVRSGLGVQLLQEQALTEFTPIIEHLSHCLTRHTRQLLLREIQEGEVARRIPRRTQSGDWAQELFFAKHLNPEFMLRVVPGTAMPQSDAVEMSKIDRMIAWGVIQPMLPGHAEVVARTMKFQLPSSTPDDSEAAMGQARHENWLLFEQPEAVIHTWAQYNHRVHLNEHLRFFNSARVQKRIHDELEQLGQSPTLMRFNEHQGLHKGHLIAIEMGMHLPQPIPPFEDMAIEMQGQGGQGGPQGGGGRGKPGAFTGTGSQMGFNRGSSMAGDQMRNQAQNLIAPRMQGQEGSLQLGGAPQVPTQGGSTGGV